MALAACATVPDSARLGAAGCPELPRFQLEGRLQVRDGERSAAVGVYWEHAPELDSWLFTGPLGQGLARIESKAGGARMILSDGSQVSAGTAAELAESVLGVGAPLAELPRWVTARVRPHAEVRALDALGRPSRSSTVAGPSTTSITWASAG
jgi:outer membrane biogenesis lipoprotein LolB